MSETPLLKLENVGKEYFGNRVLSRVNFSLKRGEVLGLVGENGAGKSTLMNILFGMPVIAATGGYEGTVYLDGNPVRFSSPFEALEAGIGGIFEFTSELCHGRGQRHRVAFRHVDQAVLVAIGDSGGGQDCEGEKESYSE